MDGDVTINQCNLELFSQVSISIPVMLASYGNFTTICMTDS